MKRLIVMLLFFAFLLGNESPVDKIKSVGEELLKSYTQPLINSFGILTNTGLFHSAYTHSLLGFDLSLKLSLLPIPQSARFFSDSALACSLRPGIDSLLFFKVYLESAPTIFGSTKPETVSVPGNAVAIPKVLPGGLNLPLIFYFTPQLNVGLPFGSELTLRYIPFPFKLTKVKIYGVGLKSNLNQLSLLKNLPFALALGLAYQSFTIGDVLKASNVSAHLLAGKRLLSLEPSVGLAYEMTKVNFNYDFRYKVPSPTGEIEKTKEVKISLKGKNRFRANLGCGLKLGPLFCHLAYEKALYPVFALTTGLSLR